jgi:hypothetical protein
MKKDYNFDENLQFLSTSKDEGSLREWVHSLTVSYDRNHKVNCICNSRVWKEVNFYYNITTGHCIIVGSMCKKKFKTKELTDGDRMNILKQMYDHDLGGVEYRRITNLIAYSQDNKKLIANTHIKKLLDEDRYRGMVSIGLESLYQWLELVSDDDLKTRLQNHIKQIESFKKRILMERKEHAARNQMKIVINQMMLENEKKEKIINTFKMFSYKLLNKGITEQLKEVAAQARPVIKTQLKKNNKKNGYPRCDDCNIPKYNGNVPHCLTCYKVNCYKLIRCGCGKEAHTKDYSQCYTCYTKKSKTKNIRDFFAR